jgi:hypothetical protein
LQEEVVSKKPAYDSWSNGNSDDIF